MADYLLKAKTISNHLVAFGEIIPLRELVLYILNGLGLKYFSFVTTFNMTQLTPYVGILHNHLEMFERMLVASDCLDQDSIIQDNLAHFLKNNGAHSY